MKLSMEMDYCHVFGMTYKYLKIAMKIQIIHQTLVVAMNYLLELNIELMNHLSIWLGKVILVSKKLKFSKLYIENFCLYKYL